MAQTNTVTIIGAGYCAAQELMHNLGVDVTGNFDRLEIEVSVSDTQKVLEYLHSHGWEKAELKKEGKNINGYQ